MRPSRLAAFLIFALCACSSEPPPSSPAPLDYSLAGKINLDVLNLSFVDRGVDQPPQEPVVKDQFQPAIADAVHRWASDRLEAVGTSGQADFVVKNAYVTVQPLPTDTGVGGWFEREQASKYTGHVEVEISVRGSEGDMLATANATRTVSLPENPTENEKQAAYRTMLDGLMQDLDKNLDQAIHDHLNDFIVTAPVIGSKLPAEAPAPESPGMAP